MGNGGNTPIKLGYEFYSIGGAEVEGLLTRLNNLYVEIRKNKIKLSDEKGSSEDPEKLKQVNDQLAALKVKQAELVSQYRQAQVELKQLQIQRAEEALQARRQADIVSQALDAEKLKQAQVTLELKKAQVESKQLQLQRQQELNVQRLLASGNDAVAGSYNDIAKQYRELLAQVKQGLPLSGAGQQFTEQLNNAKKRLKELKSELDNFNRDLSSDGTLIGEYSRGIAAAFNRLGLNDLITNQLAKSRIEAERLDEEFRQLTVDFRAAQAAADLSGLEKELNDNSAAAATLTEQIRKTEEEIKRVQQEGKKASDALVKQLQAEKARSFELASAMLRIRDEMNKVKSVGAQSLSVLETQLIENRKAAAALESQIASVEAQLNEFSDIGSRVTSEIRSQFNLLKTDFAQFFLQYLSFQAAIQGLKDLFARTSDIDSYTAALRTTSKTEVELLKNQQFLADNAELLGQNLQENSKAFTSFYTAATQAGIGADEARKIFLSASTAAAALKLKQDDTNGVLLAFGQIASKGTVQAEELRGQIGERIPGAFSIAAKAIGVTQQELNKLLQQGKVTSADFLPKFAAELQKTFGGDTVERVEGLTASTNRFYNAITNLIAGNGNISKFFRALIDGATSLLQLLGEIGGTAEDTAFKTAVAAQKEANEAQALVTEYEELSKKVNLTTAEKERLQQITATLGTTFGDSVYSINQETGALQLNLQATKDLITQKLLLANQEAAGLASKYSFTDNDIKKTEDQLTKVRALYKTTAEQINALGLPRFINSPQRLFLNPDRTARNDYANEATIAEAQRALRYSDASPQLRKQFNDLINQLGVLDQRLQKDKQNVAEYTAKLNELGFTAEDVNKLLNPTGTPPPPPPTTPDAPKNDKLDAALQNRLRAIDAEQKTQQSLLEAAYIDQDQTRKTYNDKFIGDERTYLQELLKLNEGFIAQKLAAIVGSNSAEKDREAELRLELINGRKKTNDALYKLDLDALNANREKLAADAKQQNDEIQADPATSEAAKKAAAVNYFQYLLDLQKAFNAAADELEKQYNKTSQQNTEQRGRDAVDAQRKVNQAVAESNRASQDNEISEIRNRYNSQLQKIQEDVYARALKIFSSGRSKVNINKELQDLQRDATKQALAADNNRIQQELAQYQYLLDNKLISQQAYNDATAKLSDDEYRNRLRLLEQELSERDKQQRRIQMAEQSAMNIFKTFADSYVDGQNKKIESNYDEQSSFLEKEKETTLAQAQSTEEKAQIEEVYAQRQKALEEQRNREQFEVKKKQLALEFVLASARAISNALAIPGAGIVDALIAEAFVVSEYAAQLAVLENNKFEFGGQVPTATGGDIGGQPHYSGGTPFYFSNRLYEAERGEMAIINKNSTSDSGQYSITGTPRQIASAVNSIGGGVSFAPGAALQKFEYGGALGGSLPAPLPAYVFNQSAQANDGLREMVGQLYGIVMATNGRIDRLQVVNDPNATMRAANDYQKAVSLGTL